MGARGIIEEPAGEAELLDPEHAATKGTATTMTSLCMSEV
jgi:hypothetical protein